MGVAQFMETPKSCRCVLLSCVDVVDVLPRLRQLVPNSRIDRLISMATNEPVLSGLVDHGTQAGYGRVCLGKVGKTGPKDF